MKPLYTPPSEDYPAEHTPFRKGSPLKPPMSRRKIPKANQSMNALPRIHSQSHKTPSPKTPSPKNPIEARKGSPQEKAELLTEMIEKLHSASTEDLKEGLKKPKHIFEMGKKEIRSMSATRINDIREQLAQEARFKNIQFQKDIMTKKGVEKIMRKKYTSW